MSTPEFLNNLTSFLKGQEHRDLVASPGHDDMLRLIEYLDAVSPRSVTYPGQLDLTNQRTGT